MTVKQLKKLIDKLPDNMLVVVSSDSEGNRYSEAYSGEIHPFNKKENELYDEEYEKECLEEGELYKKPKSVADAFILWP